MKVIGVVSTKGGVGKTTTVENLAAAALAQGHRPALIDLDRQATLTEWAADRPPADWPVVAQIGEGTAARDLPDLISQAKDAGATIVIVDTPPHYTVDLQPVVDASDVVLLLCQPAIKDLRGIAPAANVVHTRKAADRTHVLLNLCPPKSGFSPPAIVSEARAFVEREYQLTAAPLTITRYEDVRHASTAGQGVVEYNPDGKSASEWLALLRFVLK